MQRKYEDINVYEAFQKRLDFIFQEFDNIYVSFSCGKDSGLLLHMLMKYKRDNKIPKTIGVFHQDFEAQYKVTTECVENIFEQYINEIEPYWVCLPMAVRTALSNYQIHWYPWNDKQKELWISNLPNKPYLINLDDNPIYTYRYRMLQEDLAKQFGRWYKETHDNKKLFAY
ncbi:Phosphoadenosine phosphosulfate reductase family protein [Tissierella praeacuta DSM 18095]|uniref:Phosphoadenosine phosphosulfate reductase family protein n=2 Tax=Tissierella praeacuta TaxID=43131 RepID=A0A1M4ZMH5_9FIRM|nr:phosphoadenosine phosphosulfate reductase family protein [Tissierella praeacuta]SHF19002.1 Phosphoadenosine phosphosulfate reductase family protein [Tissierella praeacuta DSM 18095]SUP02286.1 Predicted phosphoadenosine phosphosulfate sulfotransferase [Tissierella praeacuta]